MRSDISTGSNFIFFPSALRVSSRQQNKAVSSDFSKNSRFLKHDLLHSMSWLNSKWVVKLSMSHHFPTYSRTIVFSLILDWKRIFKSQSGLNIGTCLFLFFFRLVIGRWLSLIWRLTDLKGKGEQALYTNPVKLQEGGCRMWLQALTSGFQRMRVKVAFVRTEKYMLLTVFCKHCLQSMWHLWKQLWWCGCVLAFYGITGHFCWGQMYSISHCIWTQIGLAWLYINCYKMTQLLGLREAFLWRIVGTVMKYEVSNNLNSNNCRVKVFLTHRCLVYFYHRKWL